MQFERRTEASAPARLLRPDSRTSGEGPNDKIVPSMDGAFTVGAHTITLIVIDSKCLAGVDTVNINVTQ